MSNSSLKIIFFCLSFLALVGIFVVYLYKINSAQPAPAQTTLIQNTPVASSNDSNAKQTEASSSTTTTSGIPLGIKTLLSDKIDILLPKEFEIMSEEMLKTKYPSAKRPTIVYTNKDGSVNVAFNHLQNKASIEQLPEYKNTFENTFKNLYPSATWYSNKIIKINNIDTGILEFLTPAVDTQIYNLIAFTPVDGKLLLISFNCTKEQLDVWKAIGINIINSLKVK